MGCVNSEEPFAKTAYSQYTKCGKSNILHLFLQVSLADVTATVRDSEMNILHDAEFTMSR